jgi:hypothetical protein
MTAHGIGKMLTQNCTIPYKTDLMSSSLPAYERCLPTHAWIAASNLWRSGENWLARSLCGLRGTPKYLKGKEPSEKPVSNKMACFKLIATPPK